MTLAKRKVISALKKKGFEKKEDGHHIYFRYQQIDGRPSKIVTRISHGTGNKDLGSFLVGEMARQCRLRKDDFVRLVRCPLRQKEYEELITDLL